VLNTPSSGVYTSEGVGEAIRTSARITSSSTWSQAPSTATLRAIRLTIGNQLGSQERGEELELRAARGRRRRGEVRWVDDLGSVADTHTD